MPTRTVATIIVDPHMLVREGLTSLISSYSYRVLGSYNSAKQIQNSALAEEADKLAIQTDDRLLVIPWASVQHIEFSPPPATTPFGTIHKARIVE